MHKPTYHIAAPQQDPLQALLQRVSYRNGLTQQAVRFCATQLLSLLYAQFFFRLWCTRHTLTVAEAVRLGLGLAVSSSMGMLFSRVIDTPRPYEVNGIPPLIAVDKEQSLPSTHAMQATALMLQLLRLHSRPDRAIPLQAVLVILGRLGTNVHYTRDVLAGFGSSAASCWLLWRLPLPQRWDRPLQRSEGTIHSAQPRDCAGSPPRPSAVGASYAPVRHLVRGRRRDDRQGATNR